MTLFFSLLPIYLLGNLHCAGMCGPLVMLLAKHPFRWLYFLGRLTAFSFAGLLSAEIGMVFFSLLNHYHISAVISLIFGSIILVMSICILFRLPYPGAKFLAKQTSGLSHKLAQLIADRSAYGTFLFGLCTILLPCGQTIVVFSACALEGHPLSGLLNGFFFALLTSPSLIAAMSAVSWLPHFKRFYHLWMGSATLIVGVLACLRGFADLEWIPHFILNPDHHIALF